MASGGLDPAKIACLRAIGVTLWLPRETPAAPGAEAAAPGAEATAPDPGPASRPAPAARDAAAPGRDPGDGGEGSLEELRRRVERCEACALAGGRTRTVFGVGDPRAACMLIGEGPGADEDRQGEPFVGRAGRLLNEMLGAIGLAREGVYIANIVKCRPPNNRDPRPEEVAACAGYLAAQVAAVRPRVIVALGRVAAQNLLGSTRPIGRLRGRDHVHAASGVAQVATYHPAYLLRSPQEKRKAWDDLCRVRALLAEGGA